MSLFDFRNPRVRTVSGSNWFRSVVQILPMVDQVRSEMAALPGMENNFIAICDRFVSNFCFETHQSSHQSKICWPDGGGSKEKYVSSSFLDEETVVLRNLLPGFVPGIRVHFSGKEWLVERNNDVAPIDWLNGSISNWRKYLDISMDFAKKVSIWYLSI